MEEDFLEDSMEIDSTSGDPVKNLAEDLDESMLAGDDTVDIQ